MSDTKQVLVRDVLLSADAAAERMSAKNPHRILIRQMQAAIIELAQRAAGQQPEYLASQEQVDAQ